MAVTEDVIFEVGFKYTVNGQVCRNYIHFRPEEEIPAVSPSDVATVILEDHAPDELGNFVADLLDVLADNAILDEVTCQPVFPVRYRKKTQIMGDPGEGDLAANAQNLQVAIEKYAEASGRKFVGGVRIGAVPPGNYDDGLVTAAAKLKYAALADVWFAQAQINVLGSNYQLLPVIAHRENLGTPTDPDWEYVGSTPVVGYTVQPQIRTQRTRTIGKGE